MTHSQRATILGAAVFSVAACFGQTPPPLDVPKTDFFFQNKAVGAVSIVAGQFNLEGKVVKGQPYMADAVTETTQTLSDGNHISRKETASVARDSEGRTRREQVLGAIGPWATAASASSQKIVFINDPVAQVNYVLEPDHTARKMTAGPKIIYDQKTGSPAMVRTGGFAAGAGPATLSVSGSVPGSEENSKTEDLGLQTMEGVQAQGTRITTTIPAGQIGNELPIEIVSERWYSPELQTTILTKFVDPRMGETVFRLANIQRTEPPASSFEVPPDYKVEDVKDMKAVKEASERLIIKDTN